jgi:hypothetical protein
MMMRPNVVCQAAAGPGIATVPVTASGTASTSWCGIVFKLKFRVNFNFNGKFKL